MRYYLFGTAAAAVVVSGVYFLFNLAKLPPELPWFYSLPWGEAILVNKYWFGGGVIALLLLIGINFLVAKRYERTDKVVATVVAAATLLLTALYLASFFRVLAIML
jgi:hypothetical protein